MPGNTAPIYSSKGIIAWPTTPLNTINNDYIITGTSANVRDIVTAGTAGHFIQRLRYKASGSTTAAVSRIFINDGLGTAALNNFLYDEVSLPTTSATNASATTTIEVAMNFALPQGYIIKATISVTQPLGGWYVGAIGGSYDPA